MVIFIQIESIDFMYYYYGGFSSQTNDGLRHIKSLPHLSIVQSKIGSYQIQLDNGPAAKTGDGNFFVAPSLVTQKITHFQNKDSGLFEARYIFLDIIVNHKYHFDDIFDVPVIIDGNIGKVFDRDFDDYENAECVCDKMRCLYNIAKHLLEISALKKFCRNDNIYPLIEFIKANYAEQITAATMAKILNISESNLYAVFKKSTGISPVKYLNEYRLAVAAAQLMQTNDSIKSIAESVGVEDQFYFSKLFKAKYHTSPQQYRKERYDRL